MTLTTLARDPLLDLDRWVGQRQATFRFVLLDAVSGLHLGELHPQRTPPPTLSHDTGRTIKRQLSLTLGPADTELIHESSSPHPLTQRLLVSMIVAGREWPLGRYMWTSEIHATATGGDTSTALLVDEMFVVDQQITTGFAPAGKGDAAVLDLLAGLPIPGVRIDPTPFPAVGGWAAGTSRGQILSALALQGDYRPAWMDHHGRFRMVRSGDPAEQIPTMDLDGSGRVIRDSIARASDMLVAPNRFVAVSNSGDAQDTPIVGTFDVPPSAPHSIAQRGFVIPHVETFQLATQEQATAAARNLALQHTVIDTVELSTPPDPRHDSYDVIRWQGANWLEVAWSMPLHPGGLMRHTLVRRFS